MIFTTEPVPRTSSGKLPGISSDGIAISRNKCAYDCPKSGTNTWYEVLLVVALMMACQMEKDIGLLNQRIAPLNVVFCLSLRLIVPFL